MSGSEPHIDPPYNPSEGSFCGISSNQWVKDTDVEELRGYGREDISHV